MTSMHDDSTTFTNPVYELEDVDMSSPPPSNDQPSTSASAMSPNRPSTSAASSFVPPTFDQDEIELKTADEIIGELQ